MPIRFKLKTDTTQTITEQIRQQVELAIAQGELSAGESIPSVRQLAVDLRVNPNTVAKALQLLVQTGSLISQKGKGYFVAENTDRFSESEKQRQLKQAAKQFVASIRPLGVSKQQVTQVLEELMPKESNNE